MNLAPVPQETAAHAATHENGKIETGALRFKGNPIYAMKSFLHILPHSKTLLNSSFESIGIAKPRAMRDSNSTISYRLTLSTKRLSCFKSPSAVFEQLKLSKSTD